MAKKEQQRQLWSIYEKNAVEGFDPYAAVVGYPGADGSIRVSMPAVVAMQWFLARYPGGSVELKLNEIFSSQSYAVYECSLLDAEGKKIGIPGVGCCQFSGADAVHANFVQTAQTKAIACALRNNGFCAPFDAKYEPETTTVIGGSEAANDPMVSMEMPSPTIQPPPAGKPVRAKKQPEEKEEEKQIKMPSPQKSPMANAEVDRLKAQLAEQLAAKGKELPAPIEGEPENDIDWALNTIIPTGTAKGLTIRQAYDKVGGAVIRQFTKNLYSNMEIQKAATAACKYYGV